MDFEKLLQTVLFLAAGYWLYNKLKSDGVIGSAANAVPADVPYYQGTAAIPAGWNPNELAKEAHQALSTSLSDIHYIDHRQAVYGELLGLTNDQLRMTYNVYKNLFYKSEGKTLTQKISDTWDSWFAHGQARNQVLVKLRMLHLN